MRAKGQTSIHLLLAAIVTMFGVMLILIIMSMSWEPWMVPVILIGNTLVWCLHIGRTGSDTFYENLCAGLLMVGFFFFGVHNITLFDIPAVACMLILVFSMFNKKRLLYMTAALYVMELLYHFFILHTVNPHMGIQNMVRLGFGATVVAGSMAIAIYRINRRQESRKRYDSTLAELETAGRQNAEFLSNVSHELRTPINMVLGISEVILEKDISPEIRTDMQSIQMAGKRLSNQINNMLDYTEIVEGTLTPAKETYMITSVLNDIITMTAMQSSKHQLEMVFDLDPRMPSALIGDAEKISHVLKILLDNSIKFTEEGGINVCIGFRRESYGINLIIDIYDTGIGMSDSQLTQMCDDFYQAESGSNRFAGGLGLGLPIARGLLHAMGGFIHFDSHEQEGLQAHITIPQGVESDIPAMVVTHPERLCIACYFRTEKYSCDDVRRYYDNMILHMVEGLNLEGYQAHNFEGLLKLQNSHPLTHVFIAQAEYEENSSYYEELTERLHVVVIAERDFIPDVDSQLMVIRKPFFALSVVNLLNGEVKKNGFEEALAAGRKPFSCQGVRVLAVDDEEMNLVVAKGVLGSYGIQVDTCLSGREALERCAVNSYDIVFLDHMMPGFDGVETLKRIREMNNGMYQDLPVIALTANTISGAREMFRSEGFTEFIPKPIERAVLERVLRKVLPKNSMQYNAAPVASDESSEKPAPPSRAAGKRKKKSKKAASRSAASSNRSRAKEAPPEENVLEDSRTDTHIPEDTYTPDDFPKDTPASDTDVSGHSQTDMHIPEESAKDSHDQVDFQKDVSALDSSRTETPTPENSSEDSYALDDSADTSDSDAYLLDDPQAGAPITEDSYAPDAPADVSDSDEIREEDEDAKNSSRNDDGGAEDSSWDDDDAEDSSWEDDDDDTEDSLWEEDHASGDSSLSFAPLSKIGINIQLGLDYCCGEAEFYLEMLQMFCVQAVDKRAELVSLYNAANWADYTVKVHALKSTAMTIGAERLSDHAKLLEQAGKKGNIEFIRHDHPALLRLYDEVCDTITGLYM